MGASLLALAKSIYYAGRQLHGYFEMLRTTKTLNMLNEISTQQQKLKLAIIT